MQAEKARHLYRGLADLLLLIIEAGIFYLCWMRCYNPLFRNPYRFRGNIFAALVYTALILIITRFYGRQRLGYHKSFGIIMGLGISMVLTNIAAYFFIILQAATWYVSPVPALLYLNITDIAVIILWCLIFNNLFRRIFPPNRMILVTQRGADEILAKFALRSDRYLITKVIEPDELSPDALRDFDGVVVGDIEGTLRNDILKLCFGMGIRTYTLPKITDIILKNSEVMELLDTPVFLWRGHGLSPEQEIVKRLEDIVLSSVGLIVTSPLMALIAILIKLEDGGSVFYRQRRCTRGGREFEILKFRSMIEDAEAIGVSVPALDDDPRITRVGRVIRATRLDELPQLINIFMGDMSVVGPRPERVEHVREYEAVIPEFRYRLMVKGGLTGYAQVYGKYNTSPYDKLKMDCIYISQYSLVLDIEIILRTIAVLFTRESTEGFTREKSEEMTRLSSDNRQ